jgi:hypothetical protein
LRYRSDVLQYEVPDVFGHVLRCHAVS